ncbi:hypothetical protein RGQ13_11045 [Thalassotalea psychrophila]|uniref:Lipoprotein n=1 Tax=Thalassotalea psychrophila TaxID=3065647 RepID=A0ABY9TPM2_9GAMM|nr:hypothetical protein RGQ13_11045 [Colwelliaceae bacterium SQ149]
MLDMQINFSKWILIFFILAYGLVGCGGGESSSTATEVNEDTPKPETEVFIDHSPSPEKLTSTAETSNDLYVDADFNFQSFRTITLDIHVQSYAGDNIGNSLLYVSSIDTDITELDDSRLNTKSLITVSKTDNNGQTLIKLETPQIVNNLLIEINSLGVNNKHIVDISQQDYYVLYLN